MLDVMIAAWTWLKANWWAALVAFFAAVQIINAATDRWDEYVGPGWKRFLLLLTEMGSVLTSKGYSGFLAFFKWPLNPYGGTYQQKPPSFPPGVSMFILCAALGGAVVTDVGCAASWSDNANKSIAAAHELAKGGWSVARPILRDRCQDALIPCDPSDVMSSCEPYQKCFGLRRDLETAYIAVQSACAIALDALAIYDRLRATRSDETGPRVTDQQMTLKQAEIQEKIDRAHREAIELVRRLEKEGLYADD